MQYILEKRQHMSGKKSTKLVVYTHQMGGKPQKEVFL